MFIDTGDGWTPGRSPQGECGLKLSETVVVQCVLQSLPARGVWIEIKNVTRDMYRELGRSPQGECGLKS